jgi:hypothetical protein
MRLALLAVLAACGSSNPQTSSPDAPTASPDGGSADAATDAPSGTTGLGAVGNVTTTACPNNTPAGATCRQVTVSGCPGIETESITATVAFLPVSGSPAGTIVHFSGGGGTNFEEINAPSYAAAGFQQVFVAWGAQWEQTTSAGVKTAACRPATILQWVFDEPTLHNGSRTIGFCGQGFSGGSGQLGYALAQFGLGGILDYVNELSGPPFARIDLGCDGSAPATSMVCGVADTMHLPPQLDSWENTSSCGMASPPAADVSRWMADSIAVGGDYSYPNTRVEFFDCTNQATAVTAMAQIYHDEIAAAGTSTAYHCYAAADGCSGEQLGNTGNQDAAAAMIAGCVARH